MDRIKIEMLSVEELIPYAKNPRDNKKAIDKVAASIKEFGFKVPIIIDQNNEIVAGHTRLLAASIKEFGFKVPIIIDQNNEIVAGHTRLLAAKKLELHEVPVIKVTDLTSEQVKAFRIADNKTAEYSEWNLELLAKELEELKLEDYNIEFTGFDIGEAERLMSEFVQENESFEDGANGDNVFILRSEEKHSYNQLIGLKEQ